MKHISIIIQKIKSLNKDIIKYDNRFPKIDINKSGWLEEAARQSMEVASVFAEEFANLRYELISHYRTYSKEDISALQDTLGEAYAVLSGIKIADSEISDKNLEDAFFLLLLKGKHKDYRDCLLKLSEIIGFASKNKIEYKNAGKRVSELFDDYKFHIYFDEAMQ